MRKYRALQSLILKRLCSGVESNKIPADLRIKFKVAGGSPRRRVHQEARIKANGQINVKQEDRLRGKPLRDSSSVLDRETLLEVLGQVCAGAEGLALWQEATFLPDSLVGTLTVRIGGATETFFFNPTEQEEVEEDEDVELLLLRSTQMLPAVGKLNTLINRLLA